MTNTPTDDVDGVRGHHRTIDRVTQILEEVVYHPGISFAELARALNAPKSSVHGFIRGLLAKGWLYEEGRRFYLGPAVYGLTLAGGRIRAGLVSQKDLDDLHEATGMTVFLGVEAGDNLFYIGDSGSGSDAVAGFAARANIRRGLLSTAGGKALLAARPDIDRDAFLRRNQDQFPDQVSDFLAQLADIQQTGVAVNFRHRGTQIALATVIRSNADTVVGVAILVGQTAQAEGRRAELEATLLRHVADWSREKTAPREAI